MAMESNHACGEWALCPSMLRSSPILLTTAPQPEWKGGRAPAPSRRRANCSCLADSPLKPPNLPRAPLAPRHLPPALPSYPLSPQCLSSNTSPPSPNHSGSPNTGFWGARPFLEVSLGTCGRVSFRTECQTRSFPGSSGPQGEASVPSEAGSLVQLVLEHTSEGHVWTAVEEDTTLLQPWWPGPSTLKGLKELTRSIWPCKTAARQPPPLAQPKPTHNWKKTHPQFMPQGEGLWKPWLANTTPLSHTPRPPAPLPTPSPPKAPPAMPRWGSTAETLVEIWTRIHCFWGSALHTGRCAVLVERDTAFAARGENHFALHPPLHLVSQEAAGFSFCSSGWNWGWRRRWDSCRL